MLKTFDFRYVCVIVRNEGVVSVSGYNSPYVPNQDEQSLEDILFAVNDHHIVDVETMTDGVAYSLKFLCRFVEDAEGKYDQLFNLEQFEEVE